MKKNYLGDTRVRSINGTKKSYNTVGINMDRKAAVELKRQLTKITKNKEFKGVKKVVLTTFKDRTDEDGMRMVVSAY